MKIEKNQIFNVKISQVLLKTVFKILGGLQTDKIKLCITPKDITIVAFDESMVAKLDLKLEKSAFEKFEATEFEIGLDLKNLKKIVNLALTNDTIAIKFDNKKSHLILELNNLKTRLGIIDINEIPEARPSILSSSGYLVLYVKEFNRAITAARDIADSIVLRLDKEKFELDAEKDTDSMQLSLSKKDLMEHNSDASHKNSFSSKHLSNIIGCLNDKNLIRLRFGNETPLQLNYDFSGGVGHMTYVLLPQVESEQ